MFKNLSTEALGISGRQSDIIELTLSNGFKGIDLDLVDFAAEAKAQGLAKAARLIESARLKIGAFRLPVAWEGDPAVYKRDLEALPALLDMAKQLGAARAITTIEPASDARPYHENFEFHRRRFTEIAEVLQPYGIRLGLEFLSPEKLRESRVFQYLQTVDAVLQLLKMIGGSQIGLVVDAWHWHLGGGTLEQIKALGADKIIAVYLADADPDATAANADETSRKLPGETGAIDSPALLRLLAERNYAGPVTPRPHAQRFAGLGRDKIVKLTGAALDQVWKAAGLNPQGKLATVSK